MPIQQARSESRLMQLFSLALLAGTAVAFAASVWKMWELVLG